MDLSLNIAVGSSLQIALGIIPLMVILGWIINQPMTFSFGTFETTLLLGTVLMFNYLIIDGKSNWLEGAMLLVSKISEYYF